MHAMEKVTMPETVQIRVAQRVVQRKMASRETNGGRSSTGPK